MVNLAKSTLYLFDQSCNPAKAVRYCRQQDIQKVFLCPVTTDQDVLSAVRKAFSLNSGCQLETLDYLKCFDSTAFSERDNFVEFVSSLGRREIFGRINLKQYFKYPGCSFSAWWLSAISEKDPVKTQSYHNLIRLLTILKLKEKHQTNSLILDLSFDKLYLALAANSARLGYNCKSLKRQRKKAKAALLSINFLKAIKFYLYSLYKVFIVRIYMRGLDYRKQILENAQYAAITYFPFVDKQALEQKRFVDRYYNSLQVALENKHKNQFIWLAMDSDIGDLNFKQKAKLGREINLWNYPLYFIEEWVAGKDLLAIFGHYIYFALKFLLKMPYFCKAIHYAKAVDIGPVLEEDWFTSFTGSPLMDGIIYYTAFKNIARRLNPGTIVIYLAENKPWEKALNFALQEEKKSRSIAIIHTSVPLLALQFFDYPDDLRNVGRNNFAIPTPNFLACNGRITLDLFRRSGWEEEKAFLWFALRYQHLRSHLQNRISWQARQDQVLVALPYSALEARELLHYIHQAFNTNTDYRIIVKGHYALGTDSLIQGLNLRFKKETFFFSEQAIEQLLPTSKAMVVTGSSAALDSIAFGCPVIIPKLSSVVDMNPLSGISDFPIYSWSPRELKTITDEIIYKEKSRLVYDKCKNFIERYFEFFNSEQELMEQYFG